MISLKIHQAFLFSLIIHCTAFIFLSFSITVISHHQLKPVINSFLYYQPKKLLKENSVENTLNQESNHEENITKTTEHYKLTNSANDLQYSTKLLSNNIKSSQTVSNSELNHKINKPEKPIKQFAQQQLIQLRNSINRANKIAPKLPHHNEKISIFNAATPINRSKNSIISTVFIDKNTTQYSPELSIIKNNDGSCTITEDLSNSAAEGIISVQKFSCGENQLDKSFRLHMSNITKQLQFEQK